jgi:hypothetical protein
LGVQNRGPYLGSKSGPVPNQGPKSGSQIGGPKLGSQIGGPKLGSQIGGPKLGVPNGGSLLGVDIGGTSIFGYSAIKSVVL